MLFSSDKLYFSLWNSFPSIDPSYIPANIFIFLCDNLPYGFSSSLSCSLINFVTFFLAIFNSVKWSWCLPYSLLSPSFHFLTVFFLRFFLITFHVFFLMICCCLITFLMFLVSFLNFIYSIILHTFYGV